MKRVLPLLILSAFLCFSSTSFAASPTLKKALVVGKAGLWGFAGGLILGLASQAIESNTKNIFKGGSLGLYAGLLAGVYIVATTHALSEDSEGKDTYDDYEGALQKQRFYLSEAEQKRIAYQKSRDLGLEISIFQKRFSL